MGRLSDDTTAILLLYAWFGGEGEQKPLTLQEYNKLERWLIRNHYSPGDLIDHSDIAERASRGAGLDYDRLASLLSRGITLGFYLEAWERRGFWVVSQRDISYPDRIQKSLKSQAPPVLFGTGEMTLLDQIGVAVLGPDQEVFQSGEYARETAMLCAQNHHSIIVAGKHAVSTAAVRSAIDGGGSVIWLRQGAMLAEPHGKMLRNAKGAGKSLILSTRSPADQRSIPQEPEIGKFLMGLCNSVVYIDGAELSTDQYGLEMAIRWALPNRKCFVLSAEHLTAVAEGLVQEGAKIWTNAQDTIETGLFVPVPEELDVFENTEDDMSNEQENIPENGGEEMVQEELFGNVSDKPQPLTPWTLTRSDKRYPGIIRANMDHAPLSIHGIGSWSLLCPGGLAIIGPDAIPRERTAEARKEAFSAAKQGKTVIVAGYMNMAKKIVKAVHECSGRVIWVLSDRESALKRYLDGDYAQIVRDEHLVILTAQNPDISKKSSEKSIVTSLAVEFADRILYVDGFPKNSNDRFEAHTAAQRRPDVCHLLPGDPISPLGKKLRDLGVKDWTGEETGLRSGYGQ